MITDADIYAITQCLDIDLKKLSKLRNEKLAQGADLQSLVYILPNPIRTLFGLRVYFQNVKEPSCSQRIENTRIATHEDFMKLVEDHNRLSLENCALKAEIERFDRIANIT